VTNATNTGLKTGIRATVNENGPLFSFTKPVLEDAPKIGGGKIVESSVEEGAK